MARALQHRPVLGTVGSQEDEVMSEDQGSQRERRETQQVAPSLDHGQTVANDGAIRQSSTRRMTIREGRTQRELLRPAARRGGMNASPRTVALRVFGALILALAACTGPPGASGTGATTQSVTGRATAGPVCPVERNPPDPACAARAVPSAVLVIETAASSREVMRVTTAQDGRFSIALAPGAYRLVPQPVAGLMGGARPVDFQVEAGQSTPPLEVSYDTGIR
jgi:hypothetical protein